MEKSLKPKSKQVRDQILHWIRDGKYGPGDRLPSERQLASDLGMCHMSVRGGLSMLCKDDVIEKRPRAGSFVRELQGVQKVTQVALVLPQWLFQDSSQHPTIGMLLKGISREFKHRDHLLTHMVYDPRQLWMDIGQTAVSRGVKGILLWAHSGISRDDLAKIQQGGIQIVTMVQALTPPQMSLGLLNVRIDTNTALSQMIDRLVTMGHRRIAVALYEEGAQRQLEEDFLARAFCQWNLGPLDQMLISIPDASDGVDLSNIGKFMDHHPETTAVIAYDEFLASKIFQYCYRRHIRVPEKLSILAVYDNTPNAHPVPLTAPDTPYLVNQVGQVAAQYLARMINGDKIGETEIKLRCDVQWKESVLAQEKSMENTMRGHQP